MPIHNWTLVEAGLFHHFHQRWISALSDALNSGGLPSGFFALAEQTVHGPISDEFTLQAGPNGNGDAYDEGGVAVATAPPPTRFVYQQSEAELYAARADRITVRHRRGQMVAVIEIISPGHKCSAFSLKSFVNRCEETLKQDIHLLVVDLFPPSKRDPGGIHQAIWDTIEDSDFEPPRGKTRTLAAYSASHVFTGYVEPLGVGDKLAEMPLFLTPERYVPTPLEATYQAAWAVFPAALKPELEA